MQTIGATARIYAAVAAIGVTLSWVLALTGLANHYAQAAAAHGLANAQARDDASGRARVVAARSSAENPGCKPGRGSAG